MAINNDKNDFMGAVSVTAEKWRDRSFEACMNGFMKTMIMKAASVDIPKDIDIGVKEKIVQNVKKTIETSAAEFTKTALNPENEYGKLWDVDVAHEITTPQNLNESIMKLLAEHVYDESKDRARMLNAEFDAGNINNLTELQCMEHINNVYSNVGFDLKFGNGASCKEGIKNLLSLEGEVLVEDIKSDISELVSETEAKNSVIREAVAEINGKKAEIETKINGEAESPTDDASETGDHNDDDGGNNEPAEDDGGFEDSADAGNDEGGEETGSDEQGFEGWHVMADKTSKDGKLGYKRSSFYKIIDTSSLANGARSTSNESLDTDANTFSREDAQQILDQFRELDDGIDPEGVPENENTLSVSDETVADTSDPNDFESESAENTYVDDNGEEIQVNSDAFEYKEIQPTVLEGDDGTSENDTEISEESMAKHFFPLNLRKAVNIKIRANKRLPVMLALTKTHGQEFFDLCRSRYTILSDMLSREEANSDVDPFMPVEECTKALDKNLDLCTQVEKDTQKILEDMGILGILDNKYQRTDSHVDNALLSLFNAHVLSPMGKPDAGNNLSVSTEELYEHDLAEIFKLTVKKADITLDMGSNQMNVVEQKDELGYIDELLNEKMFSVVRENDREDVEQKVKALYSLECVCPMQEIANIQAFISKTEGQPERPRVVLDSLKEIDGYGYSYADEIEKIKKNVHSKFEEQYKEARTSYNFDTDKIVEMVAEQVDTTKTDANLFEKTLSRLCENRTIETSTEGLILRNKAKAIVTGYLVADKLGFLREDDKRQLQNYIF